MQSANRHAVGCTQHCGRRSIRLQQGVHQPEAVLFRRVCLQHRPSRQRRRAQGAQPARRAMVREHVLLGSVDQTDMAVPKADEPLGGGSKCRFAINVQVSEGAAGLAASMSNERHTAFQQISDARVVVTRACEQNPVNSVMFDQMAIRVHLCLARRRTHEDQVEAGTRQKRSDRTQHPEKELIERTLLGWHDDADGATAAGA